MSVGLAIQVADELAGILNAGSAAAAFSRTFTAARRYIPRQKLEDLGTLAVSVVAAACKETFISRSRKQIDTTIEVGIQKRLAKAEDFAEIDDLTGFSDEVTAFLEGDDGDGSSRRLLPSTQASLMAVETNIADPGHMRDEQVFTCVLRLTYLTMGVFR